MSGKENSWLNQKTWSKMQMLYFCIALANLLITIGGLYMGHLLISLHENSVAETTAFDKQLQSTHLLSDAVEEMRTSYSQAIKTGSYDQANSAFQSTIFEYDSAITPLRKNISNLFDPVSSARTTKLLGELGSDMAILKKATETISRQNVEGQVSTASDSATKLVDGSGAFLNKIAALSENIRIAKATSAEKINATVAKFHRYELFAGALLVAAIAFGAYYGHFMGRLMKRKFTEMERTNRHLDEAHQQAMAFSKEIQTVNSDMGILNRQLSENLSKLREAQDDALRKGKMAQLGNLTATVAHELRNPLSTVRTSAYLLARKIKDKGLDVDPQLQRINNGIVRCDNIITQLLDFSRSKAVKAEPTVLDIWLEKLVQAEALKLPEVVSIECYFGLGDLLVDVEPGRLERAIINLMSNASEALVGKGDDPKARYRPDPLIKIVSKITERGAEIIVTDNGPGISAENLAKIREPLFTTKNFGTGLGIPAVEQILEQHSGGLEITSVEGQGATFTLWLPVHAAAEEQAA
jgi:signal transduction histidine kinase